MTSYIPYTNLFHALIIAPILFVIGFLNSLDKPIGFGYAITLMIVACIVFLYHLYLSLDKTGYIDKIKNVIM